MEAPKRILVEDGIVLTQYSARSKPEPYVHMDLVDRLIGYAVHDDEGCAISKPLPVIDHVVQPVFCTCGLSDLIREVRGC